MKSNTFTRTTLGVRIGFTGFVIAAIAVGMGFLFVQLEQKLPFQIAFVAAATGVIIGFVGVAYSWVKDSKKALLGSVDFIRRLKWWGEH